jgi:hypothetical protein
MEDNLCPNTLTVLSSVEAVNTESGALQCLGGASIKKNLHVGKEVMADRFTSKTSMHVGEDIYVCGTIHASKMFTIMDNSMIFDYNLEPSISNIDSKKSLGSKNRKWDAIYGKNIFSINLDSYTANFNDVDIKNKISIGNNDNGEPILYVHSDENCVYINGSIMYLDGHKIPKLIISNNIMKNDLIISRSSKSIVTLTDNDLHLSSNLLLLDLNELKNDQGLVLHIDEENLISIVEIIIISNKENITITIMKKKLKYVGDNIKLLINKNYIIQLNK